MRERSKRGENMLTEGYYINDRYEIIGKIGAGGMSDVYKAKDHTLNRYVAIKVLKQEFANDENFLTKFRTEAQAAAALAHPNIVNIYDVGNENGNSYIVMEYIDGITLKTYIEKKGQLSFKEAVSIAIQVAKGIEAAHKNHIIHRDIKPQNIMISTDGKVKVTDFGIARAATSETINSDMMGSVHYASPEQARNGYVDGKSDIYSLGVVMYEMVTGRVPFDAETTVAVAIKHLQEEVVVPSAYAPSLPVSLEGIILKCMQKSPDRRYDSVSALLADLKRSLEEPDVDFVAVSPLTAQKTAVMKEEEIEQIRHASADYDEDEYDDEEELGIEDDEEGFLNPKMEKVVNILGIVAVIIIIIIVILIFGVIKGWFQFGKGADADNDTQIEDQTDEVEMVKITGMDFEAAKTLLNEMGLGLEKSATVSDSTHSQGEIISQSVEEGEMVAKNTTIYVTVAGEPVEETIEIPPVAGMTESEARSALSAFSNVVADYVSDNSVASGQVISCSPSAGTSVTADTTITLKVSSGKASETVPGVTGKTEEQAKAALIAKGFSAKVTTEYSSSVSQGNVIRQSPSEGTAAESGSTVTIVVSLGQENVKVPSVTGSSYDSAKSLIESYGLSVSRGEDQYSSTVASGTVISTNPAAGTSVSPGTSETVTVSKGPEPAAPDDGSSEGDGVGNFGDYGDTGDIPEE
jgi:serine/threonine-protein kinase